MIESIIALILIIGQLIVPEPLPPPMSCPPNGPDDIPKGWVTFTGARQVYAMDDMVDDIERRCHEFENNLSQSSQNCPTEEREIPIRNARVRVWARIPSPVLLEGGGDSDDPENWEWKLMQTRYTFGGSAQEGGTPGVFHYHFKVYACYPESEHEVEVRFEIDASSRGNKEIVFTAEEEVAGFEEAEVISTDDPLDEIPIFRTFLPEFNLYNEAQVARNLLNNQFQLRNKLFFLAGEECGAGNCCYLGMNSVGVHRFGYDPDNETSALNNGFKIAHELGHAVHNELMIFGRTRSSYERPDPYYPDSGHRFHSLEYASTAFTEGFANFCGALLFNHCGDLEGPFYDWSESSYLSGLQGSFEELSYVHPLPVENTFGHIINPNLSGIHHEVKIMTTLCDLVDSGVDFEPYTDENGNQAVAIDTISILSTELAESISASTGEYTNILHIADSYLKLYPENTEALLELFTLNSIWPEDPICEEDTPEETCALTDPAPVD